MGAPTVIFPANQPRTEGQSSAGQQSARRRRTHLRTPFTIWGCATHNARKSGASVRGPGWPAKSRAASSSASVGDNPRSQHRLSTSHVSPPLGKGRAVTLPMHLGFTQPGPPGALRQTADQANRSAAWANITIVFRFGRNVVGSSAVRHQNPQGVFVIFRTTHTYTWRYGIAFQQCSRGRQKRAPCLESLHWAAAGCQKELVQQAPWLGKEQGQATIRYITEELNISFWPGKDSLEGRPREEPCKRLPGASHCS